MYYCLIMKTSSFPDPNFYSNIHDETACINKYTPVRKLSQSIFYTDETSTLASISSQARKKHYFCNVRQEMHALLKMQVFGSNFQKVTQLNHKKLDWNITNYFYYCGKNYGWKEAGLLYHCLLEKISFCVDNWRLVCSCNAIIMCTKAYSHYKHLIDYDQNLKSIFMGTHLI